MADDKKTTKAAAAGKKLVARVALKGDFDVLDGLGTAMQEVPAGTEFTTDDAKLQKQLIDNGYAKSAKDAAKDEDDAPAASGSAPTKVETTDKNDGKKQQ
ncbi:hypothetical protein [Clavibacter phage 33]|jgi:hypothetical protein|nr:hypothetical protein [Clavibacter phage 33]